ncbi:MAG: aminopeptidase 1-like [Bacteroidetes bacterium]|nr:aminopeptidase 1-like [Bacteroidota bacterium]
MKLHIPVFVLATAITFSSCNVFKKSKKDNDLAVVNLDTVNAVAKAPEPVQYQASATRLNDIVHTKLDVSFDWTKQYMYGKATITAKPHFYPQSTLVLDARGMEIKDVMLAPKTTKTSDNAGAIYNQTPYMVLKYTYADDVLTIQLDKEYKNTDEYTVFINYVSKPNELKKKGGSAAITDDKGLYFINPDGKEKNKPMEIWTQGETQSSSVWYPTIDRPNQRMTQEIYMTVENKYVTLSNGELVSSIDNGDGTRTDYWKMELPFAPYLSMMAVGDFAVIKDNKWRGKEVNYYVEKEFAPYAKDIFGNTPEMLEFFSNKLGVEFPWNKYSQIVVRDYVSGAMENVTATLHGEFLNRTAREMIDKDNEDVISHELFHQWFGDYVTCESWSNLPLNESFATYGEYLWEEYKYGLDAADAHSAESRAGYLAEAARKQVDLIRFQYDDKEDMFDGHSYNKGGQVLHMLRKYVGDDAFFASLKLYLETNKFTPVEIDNLRLAFEKVTGEDLNWFFNQWFLSPGHPELVIRTTYDAINKKETVQIKQTQNFAKIPLFKLPMYVDLYFGKTVQRMRITVTKAEETFAFDAPAKPDLVNVDAEKQLLCTKDEVKSPEELVFQYANGPLYLDRSEALTKLAEKAHDAISTQVIISALSDKFWGLRSDAIGMLKDIAPGHEAEIKTKMLDIAKNDPKSIVRSAAIDYLVANYKDADLQELYKNGLNDKSYAVLGSSLGGIAKANPEEGMKLAKQYESEKSVEVLYAIADLYSKYGNDDNSDFFVRSQENFSGFEKIGYITQYAAFLKRAKKDETVDKGVSIMEAIAKDENNSKWVAYYAKKSIKDLITMYDDRESVAEMKLKNIKEGNPNAAGTQELQSQADDAKQQKQKLTAVFNGLK